jgi:decaprenyl-phosphate phosphoribosyltransferase
MTSFGALFVVVGKRSSEQQVLGAEQVRHRATLGSYPAWMLHGLRLLAIAVTTVTYVLWTFERARDLHPADHVVALIWFELSIVPFVLALALVERAISRGRGGEPEELVLTDHVLQGLGVAWLALLLCGIYA